MRGSPITRGDRCWYSEADAVGFGIVLQLAHVGDVYDDLLARRDVAKFCMEDVRIVKLFK